MEKDKEGVIITIIIASLIMMILVVFIVLFFILFIRKRKVFEREKQVLQTTFEQTLLQTHIEIQEQTLRNVSQEIHDNIGQVLSLVSLNLNTLEVADQHKRNHTDELLTKAIDDLRSLSKSLNPERVQQVGIKEAIENDLLQMERTGKYEIAVYFDDDVTYPSPQRTVILYRMVQEVLNNIIRHAKATKVVVVFSGNEKETMITIKDNGQGFDIENSPSAGIGLRNIQNRAVLIGAEYSISSKPGHGTSVSFILNPLS